MKRLIHFLICCSVCLVSSNSFAAKIKDEATLKNEIELISDLYLKGNYYEAISKIDIISGKIKNEESLFGLSKIELKVLKSKSLYATLNFKSAENILHELTFDAEKLQTSKEKSLAHRLISRYYLNTNQVVLSEFFLAKSKTDWQVTNEFKLAFLTDELAILNAQKKFRLAETKIVEIDTVLSQFKREDVSVNQLDLANYHDLKAEYFVENEYYKEAEKHFSDYKKWFAKNVESKFGHLSRFLECEANMYWKRKQYIKANDLFKQAYAALDADEYEIKRIELLSRLTSNSVFLEDLISFQKNMRRLLLHADRNINKFNNFQIAVTYNLAYQDLIQKKYASALKRLEKLDSKEFEMPANHSFHLQKMKLLAEIHKQDFQIEKEIEVLDSISVIYTSFFGINSPATVETKLNSIHEKTSLSRNLVESEKFLKSTLKETLENSLDNNRVLVLRLETELAEVFFLLDKFNLAYDEAFVANKIATVIYPVSSWEHASYFMNYNIKAAWSGNYKEALANYVSLEEKNKLMKQFKTDGVYLRFCNQYSQLATLLGDFDLAKKYSLLSEKLLESSSVESSIYLLDIPEQASFFYIENSSLFEAEKILTKSLSFKKSKLNIHHPSFLPTYKSLVKLYIDNGNYALADKMIESFLTTADVLYGKNSLVYSEGISLKGEYSYSIGSFLKSKSFFDAELKLKNAIISSNNIELVSCYLNLAKIHSILYPKAIVENEKLFTRAGLTISNAIGKNNVLYAYYLHTVSEFYVSVKQYDRALADLKEEEAFWVSKLSKNNSHVADIYMLYAQISYNKNNYKDSEKHYVEAQGIYESVFGTAHLSYTYATSRLAKVHYMLKDKNKSLSLMESCLPQYLLYVEKYFPNLSFQEKSKFWFKIKDEFEFYNFLILSSDDPKNSSIGNVYNNILSTKAILLSSDVKLRKQISQSGDTLLINMFDKWLIQKELLASSVSKSKEQLAEENISVAQVEFTVEKLEKEMSERSSFFQSQTKKSTITWKEIQGQLKENEYAVEILKFRYFDKVFTDSVIYSGLILNGGSKSTPEKVMFKDGNNMDNMYYAYYQNMTKLKGNDTYSYKVYWEPIKQIIPSGSTIYVSGDGVFTQLNFETFKNPSTKKFALDENQFVYVTNTKDIIPIAKAKQKKKQEVVNDQYVLCGSPAFYSSSFKGIETVKELPGSEKEVRDINELLKQKNHTLLLNKQVTEDTLFSFHHIRALHIATHGYFKEADKTLEASVESNPLLNSGLLMSGAGDILSHPENYVNISSGVLTAFEVVNMNLDNTELVVLSACETGKGQVQSGEGVFGLQRSFLVAGANCIIISLFKVNDQVTQDLMVTFYSNWLATNDKRGSFVKAKKEIKEKYPDPIDWGSFIMIEGVSDQQKSL